MQGPFESIPRYRVYGGTMRSAQVAAEAGVNLQTLRYYERRGLLPEPPRLESGYRAYHPNAVRTVRFVKTAQRLGFTLEEIESLLDLAAGGPPTVRQPKLLLQRRWPSSNERSRTSQPCANP